VITLLAEKRVLEEYSRWRVEKRASKLQNFTFLKNKFYGGVTNGLNRYFICPNQTTDIPVSTR
jgi:hypothetical protein